MVLFFRQLSLPPLDPPSSAFSLLYRGVLMHNVIFLVHHHYRISSNKQRHLPYPICNRQWLLHLLAGVVPLISIFFLCCQMTASLSTAYQTTSAKPLAASRPWTTPSQLLSLLQQLLPLLVGHLCRTCYCRPSHRWLHSLLATPIASHGSRPRSNAATHPRRRERITEPVIPRVSPAPCALFLLCLCDPTARPLPSSWPPLLFGANSPLHHQRVTADTPSLTVAALNLHQQIWTPPSLFFRKSGSLPLSAIL
ncbi:hypothetical protein GW17_00054754 [Ensete ventricosum]|nr:hypothetical protein GW17_00054754 [Ensete ventricosum]